MGQMLKKKITLFPIKNVLYFKLKTKSKLLSNKRVDLTSLRKIKKSKKYNLNFTKKN